MNTEAKHTTLPWHRDADGRIVDSKGQTVRFVDLALACGYVPTGDEARGNTELMFRACNAYEPMRSALAKLEARILKASESTPPSWGGDVDATLERVESLAIETSLLRECMAALRVADGASEGR